MMNPNLSTFENLSVKFVKVLLHVAGAAAFTAVFAYLLQDKALMIYSPIINIIEAPLWDYFFPGQQMPIAPVSQPTPTV